jgi:hypothetical protein
MVTKMAITLRNITFAVKPTVRLTRKNNQICMKLAKVLPPYILASLLQLQAEFWCVSLPVRVIIGYLRYIDFPLVI